MVVYKVQLNNLTSMVVFRAVLFVRFGIKFVNWTNKDV